MQKTPISKGLIYGNASRDKFTIKRYPPSVELSMYVQHYWIAQWDLRGCDPYVAETLPYPGINLIFDRAGTKIFGVFSGKSDKKLEGFGKVCAILFRPGGFHPFFGLPISRLTDSALELEAVFGPNSCDFEAAILNAADDSAMVQKTESFLYSLHPKSDKQINLINLIVDTVIDDRSITQVRSICEQFKLSERTIQNLFSNYVGVGLKWVIMRYRLQDALYRIAHGKDIDWSDLALKLGYVDQAHFIHDFTKIIGKSPADYAKFEKSHL